MNNKKNVFKTALLAVVTAMAIAFGALAVGCGQTTVKGRAKIGTDKTAENGCIAGQILSMLNTYTDVELTIDGDKYTFVKVLKSDVKAEGSAVAAMFDNDIEIKYTFTGKVTSSEGDKYVLAPAESCKYSVKWTEAIRGMVASMLPADHTEDKTGTSESDAESLKWFYSPYVKKAEDNTKSMTVTVKGGALTFEGFDITETVED